MAGVGEGGEAMELRGPLALAGPRVITAHWKLMDAHTALIRGSFPPEGGDHTLAHTGFIREGSGRDHTAGHTNINTQGLPGVFIHGSYGGPRSF